MSRVHNIPSADNRPADETMPVWTPEQLARFAQGRANQIAAAQARASAKTAAALAQLYPTGDAPKSVAAYAAKVADAKPLTVTLANATNTVEFRVNADDTITVIRKAEFERRGKRSVMTRDEARREYRKLLASGWYRW